MIWGSQVSQAPDGSLAPEDGAEVHRECRRRSEFGYGEREGAIGHRHFRILQAFGCSPIKALIEDPKATCIHVGLYVYHVRVRGFRPKSPDRRPPPKVHKPEALGPSLNPHAKTLNRKLKT